MCTLDDFKKTENVFPDGEYTVYSEKADTIKPGDIIYLTTSEFMYDCVYAVFMKDIRKSVRVLVEILNEDLSEYVTGGCYGYAAAKVLRVERK